MSFDYSDLYFTLRNSWVCKGSGSSGFIRCISLIYSLPCPSKVSQAHFLELRAFNRRQQRLLRCCFGAWLRWRLTSHNARLAARLGRAHLALPLGDWSGEGLNVQFFLGVRVEVSSSVTSWFIVAVMYVKRAEKLLREWIYVKFAWNTMVSHEKLCFHLNSGLAESESNFP